MCHECCLFAVFFDDRHFPIAPGDIKGVVYGGVAKAIDGVIHARDWVRVRDRHFIDLPVIHTEKRIEVFLWCGDDRRGPIALVLFDCFGSTHRVHMLLHQRSMLRTGSIWLLANRTGSRSTIEAMRDAFDFAKMARPHFLVALQHGEDLFAIRVLLEVG